MKVNSYNKFFTRIAKIMKTEVKAVKVLDGRYKVELSNHVWLNVYRGASGSLVIHDHRGIADITSCYDFDNFKTMTDLYKRLMLDYSESTTATAQCEDTIIDTDAYHSNIIIDADTVRAAKQELNTKYGNAYLKHLHAIMNPNWHHVSLATLANIDNDMLDEKRHNYMYLYNLIKDFRKYAFEIIRKDVYFETTINVIRNIHQLYFNNVISFTTCDYAAKHIRAVGVEKGWFDSKSEETFGYKESCRYKVTLR